MAYLVVAVLVLALAYFVYNFYVCHRKKVDLSEENDHYGLEIQAYDKKRDGL